MTALANPTKPIRKIIPIIYNLFQMIETEETLPNPFYKTSVTFNTKTKSISEQG